MFRKLKNAVFDLDFRKMHNLISVSKLTNMGHDDFPLGTMHNKHYFLWADSNLMKHDVWHLL